MRGLRRLFKLWSLVDLDIFYAKARFGHIGVCIGKSENTVLFGNYCSHRPRIYFEHSNKWVNKPVTFKMLWNALVAFFVEHAHEWTVRIGISKVSAVRSKRVRSLSLFSALWSDGSRRPYSIGRRRPTTISNDFSIETTGSIVTKFHKRPSGPIETKHFSNGLGHMNKMAAMPIYNKKIKSSYSPVPMDRWPWNLVCSIKYARTTKIVQIMTLGWH